MLSVPARVPPSSLACAQTELIAFSDRAAEFAKLNATVIAASTGAAAA
jgi:alkyl hydroperoxide reductase subunit AhpC